MRHTITALILSAVTATGLVATPAHAQARGGCWYVVQPPFPANLWVREGPGQRFAAIDSLPYQGTAQGSCESRGGWTRVIGSHGAEGWAFSAYLRQE
ncbi:MAG: SH3 domain-containing protein [Nonomuraea sp.]|nr:SH3 domain-containing protein [Nonomuraea sp.]